VLSDEEWNALPGEEKEKRRQELREALRALFRDFEAQGVSKEQLAQVIRSTIEDLKVEGK